MAWSKFAQDSSTYFKSGKVLLPPSILQHKSAVQVLLHDRGKGRLRKAPVTFAKVFIVVVEIK
ncbi:hypothetical protein BPAE_0015g00330 [Botrytis paeoniae]|uniref:Uncharacterized protein n=1 Tax=Botrytis paeoniae TaxID=278948 RepID=A0A4Z1G2V1_9HELO|nr:hypothetical protein BPAE_0015g00330 [Botrytis paeoniae]